ncbi:sulfotransferase family protein [Shimia isoporae]|uniref:Sulfotransferase family protein n=1 Tax=Shimia isoporae TaxID=647720 RepID=A0A4R1NKJ0_9RHOB|nr:sulfotransferase family 2 domain-containing protein [Shimia isoporae]TCL08159.1 sulfotransferase family protein [Shimia isoporae]
MLSRHHKTIFVHVPKTGGQSVAQVFLEDLGLSWAERGALLMRRGETGQPERLAHLYAREYVGLGFVTQEEYDAFTTFAVIRHPYERMVSEYIYRMGALDWVAQYVPLLRSRRFEAFLEQTFDDPNSDAARHFAPQVNYVMDGAGALMVDHIVDQADLAAGLSPVFHRIFGQDIEVPRRNMKREAHGFTAGVLSARQKEMIWRRHREDFEAFGFER